MPTITSLLLDRDGTIIRDKHYLADPEGVELLPGVAEALAELSRNGMRFFLVSNQSGIGRGYFTPEDADAVNRRLEEMLRPYGVAFTDMLYCPHAPESSCACRKPAPGMWELLKTRYGLETGTSMMVGDKPEDILFAGNAGLCLRGLVLTGKGMSTAEHLSLPLPGKSGALYLERPASLSHPHLILRSFEALRVGLAQTHGTGGSAICGA